MEEQLLARLGEQEELKRIREEHLLHQERALKEKEDHLIRKQLELEGIADELLAARRAADMEKKNKEIENKQVKVLEISIEELKEVVEKREASIQELNKVILAKDSRIHNFVEMMAENDEKVQELEKQLSKAKKGFQSFKNSEFMAVKRELNSANLKLSAKERELKSISESSAQKEAQLIGLRQQLAPKDKIIFALRKDLEVQGEDFQKRLKRATAPPIQRRQMVDSISEVKADTIKSFIASAGKSMSNDKIIQAQQTFIDNFQEELSCGVCMEPAFRPFGELENRERRVCARSFSRGRSLSSFSLVRTFFLNVDSLTGHCSGLPADDLFVSSLSTFFAPFLLVSSLSLSSLLQL